MGALVTSLGGTFLSLAVAADAVGSVKMGTFAAWRLGLLITSVALLAFGFFLSYEPSSWLSGEPGKAGGTGWVRRWHRRVLWLATTLTLVFAAVPYYSGWVGRAVGQKSGLPMVRQQAGNARVVLAIEGMDCLMCAGGLQNSLRQIPGVRRAEVSYQDKQAAIEYDPSTVLPTRFVKVITESGFKVRGSAQVNN